MVIACDQPPRLVQALGLIEELASTGGDFCGQVIDNAVQAANDALLLLLHTTQYLNLETVVTLTGDLAATADTLCTIEHRSIEKILDGDAASQNSSDTIDLHAATAEDPSGAILALFYLLFDFRGPVCTYVHDSAEVLFACMYMILNVTVTCCLQVIFLQYHAG